MYRQQLTADAAERFARQTQALIDSRVPGLFVVSTNHHSPRVECKGLGGVHCGWSTTRDTRVQDAWSHFYMQH